MEYFKENIKAIQQKRVKPYAIAEKTSEPTIGMGTKIYNCHHDFNFKNGVNIFQQSFKPFDLTNDAEEKNINYEYNSNLEIVALDDMISDAIKQIENNPNFIRI